MSVTYRDETGFYVQVFVDSTEIMFLDGEIYFDSDGEEYRIKFEDIAFISR